MTLSPRQMEFDEEARLVAEALNTLGLGPWTLRRDPDRIQYRRFHTHIDGPNDLSVRISIDDHYGDGADARWEMSGYRTHDNQHIANGHRGSLPSITVAAGRPPLAVAKELMRRLLPQAYDFLKKMAESDARDAEYKRQSDEMRQFIIDTLGARAVTARSPFRQYQPGEYALSGNTTHRLFFSLGDYKDVDIEWTPDGDVRLKTDSLPKALAGKLFAVFAEYAREQQARLEATNA